MNGRMLHHHSGKRKPTFLSAVREVFGKIFGEIELSARRRVLSGRL
jgi:hypothetical protein